jgi:hypothetical protein
MKKVLCLIVVFGVFSGLFAGTMPPTGTSITHMYAYVKGIVTETNGDTYVILDKDSDITWGSGAVPTLFKTNRDFLLYIGISNDETSGPAVRTIVANLLAAKANNDLMKFRLALTCPIADYNAISGVWQNH